MNSITFSICCAIGLVAGTGVHAAPSADAVAQKLERQLRVELGRAERAAERMSPVLLEQIDNEALAAAREFSTSSASPKADLKLSQVRALVHNARIWNRQDANARISLRMPHSEIVNAQRVHFKASSTGGSCERAWSVDVDQNVQVELASARQGGDAFWFRVDGRPGTKLSLDTLASVGDVNIAVFYSCASPDQPQIAADDTYGLQAAVVSELPANGRVYVRVANEDESFPSTLNFKATLAQGISGQVTVSPAGISSLAGITVSTFRGSSSYFEGTAVTDVNGQYSIAISNPGDFNLRTSFQGGYSPLLFEAYSDVPCNDASSYYYLYSCVGSLTAVTVVDSAFTQNVNFELEQGRILQFNLTDQSTGLPLPSAYVRLYTANGVQFQQTADNVGRVRFTGLLPGVAYRALSSASGYRSEVFDNLPCPEFSCAIDSGVPIDFAPEDPRTRHISVSLDKIRLLTVYVPELQTPGMYALATLRYSSGQVAAQSSAYSGSSSTGWRAITLPLPAPGSYYVEASYPGLTFTRLHPSVDCLDECLSLLSTAQQVNIGTDSEEIYLQLRDFPSAEGVVVNALDQSPIAGATVRAVNVGTGTYVSTVTQSDGRYRLQRLRPANYLLVAGSTGHVDVAHPNVPCELSATTCPNATSILIGRDMPLYSFNFGLVLSASITGKLSIESRPEIPTTHVQFSLRKPDGLTFQPAVERVGDMYRLLDIAPGQYRLAAMPSGPSYGQVFPGIDCDIGNCNTGSSGGVLTVAQAPVSDYDFSLKLKYGLKGQLIDSSTGAGIANGTVDVWESGTYPALMSAGITDASGRFVVPTYFGGSPMLASTSVGGVYLDEVYQNKPCPFGPAYLGLCSFTGAAELPRTLSLTSTGITIRLMPASMGSIFDDGMEN